MKYNLTIGAFEWELDDEVVEEEMEGNFGLCDFETLSLTIQKGLKKQIRQSTVLHELGHAFFASAGFDPKEEERIVDILANQMLDFLQRNKEFFKDYFLKEEKDI